jgi:hypothetical protein
VKFKNTLSIMLSLIIVFASAIGYASPAQAKSSRAAEVVEVVGDVQVTKSGGSKAYRAYAGMTLNEGDHIETSEGSSLILRIKDQEDEITIDEHASLYLSELTDDGGSKKSKMKIWSGSLWGKVKTLAGSNDTFEVETPTAVMGVRGTTLLVGVDPATGQSKFFIASGLGKIDKRNNDDNKSGTILMPNQSVTLDEDSDDYEALNNVADLNELIANTSNSIIEAILNAKAAIDEENEQYIARLKADQSGGNQAEIDRINQNLDNLVGNIVNNAIKQGKVEETQIKALIDKINQNLDKKLDLANVKPIELSEQEKAKQAQIKLLEEERKKKQEAEKLRQDQLKQQNEALQNKLKEQLEKQKAEKEKAAEAAKKKAEEEFAKKLANDAARAAFENRQKALEEKKAQNTPVQPPVTAPPTSDPSGDNSGPSLPKKASFTWTTSDDPYDELYYVEVFLENVGTVYGVELHLIFDDNVAGHDNYNEDHLAYKTYFDENYSHLNGTVFDRTKSTYNYVIKDVTVDDADKKEGIYSVVYLPSATTTGKNVSTKEKLITIPLRWSSYSEGSDHTQIQIAKLIVVDQYGEKIKNITIDHSILELEKTHNGEVILPD